MRLHHTNPRAGRVGLHKRTREGRGGVGKVAGGGWSAALTRAAGGGARALGRRRRTMSDSEMTLYISPRVPLASVKPQASAALAEAEPGRSPIFTLMPVPSTDSRKFCACAGPWLPHPITPTCLIPSSADGSLLKRWRPPLIT
jgi:hypothetical protein